MDVIDSAHSAPAEVQLCNRHIARRWSSGVNGIPPCRCPGGISAVRPRQKMRNLGLIHTNPRLGDEGATLRGHLWGRHYLV